MSLNRYTYPSDTPYAEDISLERSKNLASVVKANNIFRIYSQQTNYRESSLSSKQTAFISHLLDKGSVSESAFEYWFGDEGRRTAILLFLLVYRGDKTITVSVKSVDDFYKSIENFSKFDCTVNCIYKKDNLVNIAIVGEKDIRTIYLQEVEGDDKSLKGELITNHKKFINLIG